MYPKKGFATRLLCVNERLENQSNRREPLKKDALKILVYKKNISNTLFIFFELYIDVNYIQVYYKLYIN